MIIKDIIQEVENASHPVARAVRNGENFKVLAIAFKSGMKLKDHKTKLPASITVIYGKVVYMQAEFTRELNQYDCFEIPVNEIHSVSALTDSLCFLIQG
jgi:quercetin dioxygenase-like cupin family protein